MEQAVNPKQQATEAIKQAESILITAGSRPTIDQVAAVLALAMALRKLGKRVNAVISDQIPSKLNFLPTKEIGKDLSGLRDFIMRLDLSKAEVDKLRYTIEDGKLNVFITPFAGSFDQSQVSFDHGDYNYDLAIVLGVANRERIDRAVSSQAELFQKVPIINIDFHRSNENFGAVNLVDAQAASLCEILAGLTESLGVTLDESMATAMLAGLYASTDRFTASHTTAKSLTLSAQLIAAGANQQQIVRALFIDKEKPVETPKPRNDDEQAKKNQEELKKLAELKNPEPKAESKKEEKSDPKAEKAEKAETKTQPESELAHPAQVEEPEVKTEGPAEDLAPEERVEFELPEHIKAGLASFLEP